MTWDQLNQLREQSDNEWRKYREDLWNAYGRIFSGLALQLDAPDTERLVRPVPPELKKIKDESRYTVVGAVELRDDGWAVAGLLLTLEKGERVFPKRQFLFKLMLKRKGEGWVFKGYEDAPEITLSADITEAEIHNINKHVFETFGNNLERYFDSWLKGKAADLQNRVGFDTREVTEPDK